MKKSETTRSRILETAERLFSKRGFRAMTLRDVTVDAGVNLAAVNYHFGSKDALMRAVIKHRVQPINKERLRRLDQLIIDYAPEPVPLEKIFDALLRPLFEKATGSPHNRGLIRMMGRAISEPTDFMHRMHKEVFSDLTQRFLTELQRTCPQLSRDQLQYRLFFVIDTMIGTLVGQVFLDTISNGELKFSDHERMLQELLDFVTAGFRQHETKA
ncbi:MAG: TetR family transcriptional regulator [Verrucomicrobiota bacterium]